MNKKDPALPVKLDEKVKSRLLRSIRSSPDSPAVLGYAQDGGYTNKKRELVDGAGPHISLGWYDDESKLTGGRYYRIDNHRIYVDDITIEKIRDMKLVPGQKTQIVDGTPMSFGYIRIVEPVGMRRRSKNDSR